MNANSTLSAAVDTGMEQPSSTAAHRTTSSARSRVIGGHRLAPERGESAAEFTGSGIGGEAQSGSALAARFDGTIILDNRTRLRSIRLLERVTGLGRTAPNMQ